MIHPVWKSWKIPAGTRVQSCTGMASLSAHSGKTIVIPGFSNKLIPWVVRVSPRGVVTRVVRRMQERVTT